MTAIQSTKPTTQSLPNITPKQLNLLLYLYKFTFLHTNQFQHLCNHKQPQRVQQWLKNLKDKGYLEIHEFERNTFISNMKPAIYSLTKLARKKLKNHPKCELEVLDRVYQSKSLSKTFIAKCVFLADVYIDLLSHLEEHETLHFSTRANLRGFAYFPNPLPDAYVAIKNPTTTKRYFLFLLDVRAPWYIMDRRIRSLMDYTEDNAWDEYGDDPLPTFLIVCPNQTTLKHVNYIICKNLPDTDFYLTTRDTLRKSGFKGEGWEHVELQDE